MSDVTLSRAIRSNLLHLQNTASLMDVTQERLATGLKVNSALDNPTNFFTASSLNARAADISTLLDAMGNGLRTIEAADNGLTAITKAIESMQSTLRQARQDRSFEVQSFPIALGATPDGTEIMTVAGGSVAAGNTLSIDLTAAQGTTTGDTALAALDFDDDNDGTADQSLSFSVAINGGTPVTIAIGSADLDNVADIDAVTPAELRGIINTKLAAANVDATAAIDADGNLVFTAGAKSAAGSSTASVAITAATPAGDFDLSDLGFTGTQTSGVANVTARSIDALVREINSDPEWKLAVRASNDNGKLRFENLSTSPLTVGGYDEATGTVDGDASQTTVMDGNKLRAMLASEYNDLKVSLDRLADDTSFNGINLLRGDELKIVFNENGTSVVTIQTRNRDGEVRPISSDELGIGQITEKDLNDDASIDRLLKNLSAALGEVRAQSSALGSTLSTVQNREDFTKKMINTLQTGAANLTLADSNEEAANLLALQTRQQLSQTALSLASQADQAVLRLFG